MSAVSVRTPMTTTIRRATPKIREIIRVSRPHQWVKNAAVFAAPAAAGLVFEWSVAWRTAVAMAAFIAASAVTYIINDISDAEADRLHPLKRSRPIAAGTLAPVTAKRAASVLAAASLGASAVIGMWFTITLVAYLATTTLYSTWLKHLPLVDVITVSTGFALRVVAGAFAASSGLSIYLLAGVGAAAAFISIGKRAGEIGRLGSSASSHRTVLEWYSPARTRFLLGATEVVCLGSIAGLTTTTMNAIHSTGAIAVSVVILERFRRLVAAGHVDDPVHLVVSDRVIGIGAAVFTLIVGAGVYL